jgi:hypothetical protein
MSELPGADEENELTPRLFGVAGENVNDTAGVAVDSLCDAAVAYECRDELGQQRRLADAHIQRHGLIIEFRSSSEPRRGSSRILAARPASRPRPRARVSGMRNLVDLASRRGGGIEVALIWDRSEKTLVVFARDYRTDEEVAIPVSGDEASEVYRHPFAYAHRALDDAPSRRTLPLAR